MSAYHEFRDRLRKHQDERLTAKSPTASRSTGTLKQCPGFDPMARGATIDDFTRGFFEAFFFAETDDNGDQLDHLNVRVEDIDNEGFARLMDECMNFQEKAGDMILDREAEAGRDFYFTRQGHGVGFWDGDWPDPDGDKLTELAKSFGEFSQITTHGPNDTVEIWIT